MPNNFQNLIQLISNGDPVDSSVNRIFETLDTNTKYVKDLLEAALLGSTVFARNVTVENSALVGMPVYFNALSQQFERGLAAAHVDPESQELITDPSTQVWGVVYFKHNSTSADVLLHGYTALDISNAVTGDIIAGLYYLSGTTPGKLTKQIPPVNVPVLQSDGNGNVYVNTSFDDIYLGHQHYKFDLQPVPAGTYTPPSPGDPHVIDPGDSSIEGWLPADDAVFDGNAPDGAVFGYNISQSALKNIFPPLPLSSATVSWTRPADRTLNDDDFQEDTVPTELCVIDTNGIWWMTDCYGLVPWAINYGGSPDADACKTLIMRVTLYFTKMQFQTANTVVTSLKAADNSGLTITCTQTGDTAQAGDLTIDFDSATTVDPDDDEAGHMVFKRLTDHIFYRGPVVESIRAGTGNISITSTDSSGSDRRGTVTINVGDITLNSELPIEMVRLSGSTEENYDDSLGLGFPEGRDTEYRGRVFIPSNVSDAGTDVGITLRFWILARANGDIPPLTLTARVLYRPGQTTGTALSLPTSDSSVTLSVAALTGMSLDAYVEIQSNEITGQVGAALYFTLSREGSTDSFPGEIHIIDQRAVISSIG